MTTAASLTAQDGLFELPGPEPLWLWAHTCSTPDCDCRRALLVVGSHGREALLEQALRLDAARRDGALVAEVAATLDGVDVFDLHIDTVEASSPTHDALLLDDHPRIAAVVERLDGELLEALGHLWYRGKGLPDPVAQHRAARELVIRDYKPGQMLAHDEVLGGVRDDVYKLGDRLYEVLDLHCAKPGCSCGEILLDIQTVRPRGGPHLGDVHLNGAGAVTLEPNSRHPQRFANVWAAFQKRHPTYRDWLARRGALVQEVAARIVPATSAPRATGQPKVGRNDPCPCGSGKKHKKCCGAA
jgi:hypothetical protein